MVSGSFQAAPVGSIMRSRHIRTWCTISVRSILIGARICPSVHRTHRPRMQMKLSMNWDETRTTFWRTWEVGWITFAFQLIFMSMDIDLCLCCTSELIPHCHILPRSLGQRIRGSTLSQFFFQVDFKND